MRRWSNNAKQVNSRERLHWPASCLPWGVYHKHALGARGLSLTYWQFQLFLCRHRSSLRFKLFHFPTWIPSPSRPVATSRVPYHGASSWRPSLTTHRGDGCKSHVILWYMSKPYVQHRVLLFSRHAGRLLMDNVNLPRSPSIGLDIIIDLKSWRGWV